MKGYNNFRMLPARTAHSAQRTHRSEIFYELLSKNSFNEPLSEHP